MARRLLQKSKLKPALLVILLAWLPFCLNAQKAPKKGEWSNMTTSVLDTTIERFIEGGHFYHAIPYAEQYRFSVFKSVGRQSTQFIRSLYYLADIYMGLEDYNKALTFYNQIELLIAPVYKVPVGPNEVFKRQQIELWAKMERAHFEAGNEARQEAMKENISSELDNVRSDSSTYSQLSFELGKVAEQRGDYLEAENYYVDAKIYSKSREHSMDVLDALTELYGKLGESTGQELLEEEIIFKGANYMRFLHPSKLDNFVQRYADRGYYWQAETLFIIGRESVESNHQSRYNWELLDGLIESYAAMGEFTAARLLLQEASRSCLDAKGVNTDERQARIIERVGDLYLDRGFRADYLRAIRFYGDAMRKTSSQSRKQHLQEKITATEKARKQR